MLRIIIGITLIVISSSAILIMVPSITDTTKLLTCIAFTFLGLGVRSFFPPDKIAPYGFLISYIYNIAILIIISCILYLSFYGTIRHLERNFFYLISFLLFTGMGGIIATVIERFHP